MTRRKGSLGLLAIPNWSPSTKRSKKWVQKMRRLTLSGKSAKEGDITKEYTVEEEKVKSSLSVRGDLDALKAESLDSLGDTVDLEVKEPLYVEQSRIEQGSTCAVYAAMESATGRRVALKRRNLSTNRIQMENEFDILQQLSGLEHVVAAYDLIIEDADEDIYLVMELCAGGSLVDTIVRTKSGIPYERFQIMIAQLTSAFSRMHELDIVHRDIKADNICLAAKDGGIRLIDFGEALNLRDKKPTYFNARSGTMHYLAPEMCEFQYSQKAERHEEYMLDLKKCDVFALGVTIYCALTACFPWRVASMHDALYVSWVDRGCLGFTPTWRALPYRAKVLLTNMLNPNPDERWTMDEAHSFTVTGMMPRSRVYKRE